MTRRARTFIPRFRSFSILATALLACAFRVAPAAAQDASEAATARYLEAARGNVPLQTAFVREMPKGADLHNHLSGAVYAESYIQWAADSSLCVVTSTATLAAAPCDAAAGKVPATTALTNSTLYGQLVDAWSMRNWNAAHRSGHDQFFDTFGKFGMATWGRTGDMLAEAASRAALGHVSYLELMQTPDEGTVAALGRSVGWDPNFAAMRQKLLAAGLRDSLAIASRKLESAEAHARQVMHCPSGAIGTGATPAGADAGCAVTIRWLYQVSRARSPEQVFAQILAGFEMASTDPHVVGLNLVQPEDAVISMRDYTLQMRMLDYLHGVYPAVHVTLHAGELAPGLVPPEGLRFHIRQAVELGHAERIGHGVDVMNEDDAHGLLREMAARNVMVEIALTSNAVILGVSGRDHPLPVYRRYGVPVALATDDEGVSRSDLPMEYLRGIVDQGLGYRDLKAMARTSLEHAFVQGASVWRDGRAFVPVAQCAPAAGGWSGAQCTQFAAGSPKATLQRKLEMDLRDFERRYAAMPAPAARPSTP